MEKPRVEFLSLFVPDLDRAREVYLSVFGATTVEATGSVPLKHPFSPRPPVILELGAVKLALYQADGRVTHPGDVGIGVATDTDSAPTLERVEKAGGQNLMAPVSVPIEGEQQQEMSIFVLPTRHFFELVRQK